MLSVKDCNYINLLLIITDTIMEVSCDQPSLQSCSHVRKIYDELQALWMCIMSNRQMTPNTRQKLKSYLSKLGQSSSSKSSSYPRENGDDPKSGNLLQAVLKENFQGKCRIIDCLLTKSFLKNR